MTAAGGAQGVADLLSSPFVGYLAEPHGFALTRLIAGRSRAFDPPP